MQILKTYDFISERVKIKPVTNAELDKARNMIKQQKENALYVVWPATYLDVLEVRDFVGAKHQIENCATTLFVLKKDDVKKLLDNNIIKLFATNTFIFRMNPNLTKKDIKKIVKRLSTVADVGLFLANKEDAHKITSEEELHNEFLT